MAGLLWAISAILDIDGEHIDNPASALSSQSWLMRILLIHESIKHSYLDLERSQKKVPVDSIREISLILLSGLDISEQEEQVICIACIGGFSEALCISDKTQITVVCDLLQKAQMVCASARKSAAPHNHLLCCFAACVSRVFKYVGDKLGPLEEVLKYSLITLSYTRFGIDDATQDPGAGQHIFQQSVNHGLGENLVSSTIWRITNMCSEILSILPPQQSWETLQAITRISHHLQEDCFRMLGANPPHPKAQLVLKRTRKSMNDAFLMLVKLLNSAFSKLSLLEDLIPVESGSETLKNILVIKYSMGQSVESNGGIAIKTTSALLVIEALGNLQFCRIADQEYEHLLGAALQSLMASSISAQLYMGLFPEYETLVSHDNIDGTHCKRQANPLIIAKLVFLMRLAPLSISLNGRGKRDSPGDGTNVKFKEVEVVVRGLVSYAYLLLNHREESVREAGHQFFSVLLSKLGDSKSQMAEMLAPYYFEQCLAQPKLLPFNSFERNIHLLAKILPEDGLSLKYCLQVLSEDALNLLTSGDRKEGMACFQALCKCALWFPLSTLDDCMATIKDVVAMEGGQETMPVLFRLVGSNKDYSRKIELARYYTNLHGSMTHALVNKKPSLC